MSSKFKGNVDTYKLWVMLRQTNDAIVKVRKRELKKLSKHSVTCEQAGALNAIYALGKKATAAEVARWLFREANTMTILLRGMEKKGLIKRTPELNRKNVMRIMLTKKGYEAYKNTSRLDGVNDIICKLSNKQREQLFLLLGMLRDQALENLSVDRDFYSRLLNRIMELNE